MTFKHKLSARLALMRDSLPLVPVTGLRACEQPVQLADPHFVVTRVAVFPPPITAMPKQVGK